MNNLILYILISICGLYILGVFIMFLIMLSKYKSNKSKVVLLDNIDYIESYEKDKCKKIFKPIWLSWVSIFIFLKNHKKLM